MRALGAFIIYILCVAVIGALLTPALWWIVGFGCGQFPDFEWLADIPFGRVANRAFFFAALCGLWPYLKALRIANKAGWEWNISARNMLKSVFIGLLFGIVSMALLVLLEFWIGVVVWHDGRGFTYLAPKAISFLMTGLVVSIIEETFFRGAMYTAIERDTNATLAIWATAFFYASVHFIHADWPEGIPIRWYSGFQLFGAAFEKFGDPSIIGPFLALILVGALLGYLRRDLGHIGVGLGLHAGWVMVIQLGRKMSVLSSDYAAIRDLPASHISKWEWLVSGYDDITSYLAAMYLLLMLVAWHLWRDQLVKQLPQSNPICTQEAQV